MGRERLPPVGRVQRAGQGLEELEDGQWPSPQISDRSGDRGRLRRAEHRHRRVAQQGEHLRCLSLVDLAVIFPERHIPNPVQPVLHVPVYSPPIHQSRGVGPSTIQARDAVVHLHRGLQNPGLGVFLTDHPLNPTDLRDFRPGLTHRPT